MRRGRRTERRQYRSDEGVSLVMVVVSFALLFSIVLVTSLYVVRSIRQTASYTDSEQALAAAESGIADYFSRAGAGSGYWLRTDCSNLALQEPVTDGSVSDCDWDAGTAVGWVAVDDDADVETSPAYHYTVTGWDTSNGSEATWITVQVTGRSGDQYRTVEVQATRESTEQYAGYQNHWARPGISCTDSSGAAVYQWTEGARTSLRDYPCLNTYGGERWLLNTWVNPVQGDFFSNDAAFLNPGTTSMGATYSVEGSLTLANPRCTSDFAAGWTSTSVFSTDCGVLQAETSSVSQVTTTEQPSLSASKTLPDSTSALEDAPGCRYYGPTRIVLHDDGTMTVWSKQSGYDGLTLSVPSGGGTGTVDCGTSAALVSDEGATVAVPDGMVVYVQDLPAEVVAAEGVVNGRLDAGEIGGSAEYGYLPIGDSISDLLAGGLVGMADVLLDTSTYGTSAYRTEGNLWVEGELKGSLTLGSEGSVLVTGDLVTVGGTGAGSSDQLGIVASAVTVVDQRVAVQATLRASGALDRTFNYRYIDEAEGADWPHDYDNDPDQVTIEAAIQVVGTGFGYQDADNCTLANHTNVEGGVVPGATSSEGGRGWFDGSYIDYPGVSVEPVSSREGKVSATSDAAIDVRIVGSLAQNYLSTTGVRTESEVVTTFYPNQTVAGFSVIVVYATGSCGMNLTVEYDERLASSAPPYLLRFSDVGWDRGESSEITTPDLLRS